MPAHTGPGISLRIALARIRKLPIASQDQSAPSKLDTFRLSILAALCKTLRRL